MDCVYNGVGMGFDDLSWIRLMKCNDVTVPSYNVPWAHEQMKGAQPILFKLSGLAPDLSSILRCQGEH